VPARPRISAAERKLREDTVNYARAFVGLEGFSIGEAAEHDLRRFVDGKIDLPNFEWPGSCI